MTSESLWQRLESLLVESGQERAAVLQTFPETKPWSYFDALDRIDPQRAEELRTAGKRLVSAGRLAQCPILAVAGKLNAGKTSLVASFLSPTGRARALRGEANHQGTHRFALWLPERWRADAELFGNICARIGDALGAPPKSFHSTQRPHMPSTTIAMERPTSSTFLYSQPIRVWMKWVLGFLIVRIRIPVKR